MAAFQPYDASPLKIIDLVEGVLQSISQVFLKGNGVAALLLLIGLAANSPMAAAFALTGAILAVATAHLLGAESALITGGLLGFSPVLTAIALGTVFYRPSSRVVAYTALGAVFTVIAQSALNVMLAQLAIPALTAPFVLVSSPHRHSPRRKPHAHSSKNEVGVQLDDLRAADSFTITADRLLWKPPVFQAAAAVR